MQFGRGTDCFGQVARLIGPEQHGFGAFEQEPLTLAVDRDVFPLAPNVQIHCRRRLFRRLPGMWGKCSSGQISDERSALSQSGDQIVQRNRAMRGAGLFGRFFKQDHERICQRNYHV